MNKWNVKCFNPIRPRGGLNSEAEEVVDYDLMTS